MWTPLILSQLRSEFVVFRCRMTEEVNFRRPSSFVCCSNSYGTNRVLREMFSYKKGIILLVSYPCLIPRHFPGTVVSHHHSNRWAGAVWRILRTQEQESQHVGGKQMRLVFRGVVRPFDWQNREGASHLGHDKCAWRECKIIYD